VGREMGGSEMMRALIFKFCMQKNQ
jgi:hypothetical protein